MFVLNNEKYFWFKTKFNCETGSLNSHNKIIFFDKVLVGIGTEVIILYIWNKVKQIKYYS